MRTKRDDILKAAVKLFAQKGVHGASVPQILQLANASAGAMYSYFESKHELAAEVFRLAQHAFDEHVWQDFPQHLPLRAQLREVCQRYRSFITDYPDEAVLVMLMVNDEIHTSTHQQLRGLIRSWRDSPQVLAPSVRGLFTLMQGAFVQMMRQTMLEDRPPDQALCDELEHYIWYAMTSPVQMPS